LLKNGWWVANLVSCTRSKQKINREKNKNRLVQDTWKKIHKSVKAVYGGRICSQVLSLEWTTENDKAAYWKWGDWRRLIRMGMMSWVGSWFWRQGDEYWNQQLMKMCNQLLQWSRCGDNGMMSSNAVKKVSHQIGSHTRIDVFVHYVGELCLNQQREKMHVISIQRDVMCVLTE